MTDRPISRPAARWLLGSAIVLAAMVGVVLLLGSSPSAAAGALYQADDDVAELYGAQCAACHGDEGEGGVGGALTESTIDIPERIAIITNGSGAMPAYGPTLSAAQIEELASYLDGFAMAAIYAQQCAPCHGSAGEGGIAPSLETSMLSAADRYSIIAEGVEAMPGFSLTLTPDELQGITDYVASFIETSTVGEEIWTGQCAPCHGSNSEGGVAPDIRGATTSFEDVVRITTNGVAGMPGFGPTLSPEEIRAVSRYAESLRHNPPDPTAPPATNEAGAAGYAANCAGCHAADGTGGAGPALRGTTLTVAEIAAITAAGQGGMPSYSAQLPADEIDAIAQFVADLGGPPPSGGVSPIALGAVVYTENCALCHGVDASGASARSLTDSKMTTEQLGSAIVDGYGGMSGFGDRISGDDVNATVAYLEARIAAAGGGPAAPNDTTVPPVDTTASPGDATGGMLTGAEVYLGRCATCHGTNGEGGVGSSLINTGLSVNEVVSRIYGGHEDGMPAFEGVLDAREVQNVARYVVDLEGEAADSGGSGAVLAAIALAVVVLGAFLVWRSGWLRRSSRPRRARR